MERPSSEHAVQHRDKPVDFLDRVVMYETDPDHAVLGIDAKAAQQSNGVEVPVLDPELMTVDLVGYFRASEGGVAETQCSDGTRAELARTDDFKLGLSGEKSVEALVRLMLERGHRGKGALNGGKSRVRFARQLAQVAS